MLGLEEKSYKATKPYLRERLGCQTLEWRRLSSLTTTEWAAGAVDRHCQIKESSAVTSTWVVFFVQCPAVFAGTWKIWPKLKHLPDSEISWIWNIWNIHHPLIIFPKSGWVPYHSRHVGHHLPGGKSVALEIEEILSHLNAPGTAETDSGGF